MAREHDRHGQRSAEQRYARVDRSHVAEHARSEAQRPPKGGGIVPGGDLIVGSAGAKRIRRPATTVNASLPRERRNQRCPCLEWRTRQAFGKAIDSHLIRDCAVIESVDCSPEQIGIAPDFLGHKA